MTSSRLLRPLYVTVVVNLLLWLAMLGSTIHSGEGVRMMALTGFIFAAVAQHWAFYALRKVGREGELGATAQTLSQAQ